LPESDHSARFGTWDTSEEALNISDCSADTL
jgi:hypothetical protein